MVCDRRLRGRVTAAAAQESCNQLCGEQTGGISISITFFNKAVMSYYEFHFGNALTLAQLVSSLCFMHVMKKMHLIDYKSFNKNIAKQVCSAVKQARTLSLRVRDCGGWS